MSAAEFSPFLYHGQGCDWVALDGDRLQLTLVTEAGLSCEGIWLRCEPDNEECLVEMRRGGLCGRRQFWQGDIPLSAHVDTTLYCFKLITESGQWWLHGGGVSPRMPGLESHFRYNARHQPPAWVRQQLFYQIFPDRFANGDSSISVHSGEYCLRGDQRPTVRKEWEDPVSSHGQTGSSEFYGGDLAGIESKLDYLQDLGITALYLNPIFTAPSNHKYDTTNYLTIDSHLGTNEQFSGMVMNLHDRGMRVVLDAVFNHTSADHPWFDKYGRNDTGQEPGAYGHPSSCFREFYQFTGSSNEYVGWKGLASLPKLNFTSPDVRDYIYDGEHAVIKHWLREPYGIDGWRFDVIHMLGEGAGARHNDRYVKAFRASAKSVNQECYVLGEHFFEASGWLQGDQEDGAMNYFGFGHPVRAFLCQKDIAYHPCQLDARELRKWLDEARAKIPWLNQLSQLNQLDSHDTMRFLTLAGGDRQSVHLGLLMLFAYVGTPCIYYGTEVGLAGGMDPDNRRCFPWSGKESEHETFQWIQQLARLRKHYIVLQEGSLQWLYARNRQLGFARTLGDERVICLLNASDSSVELVLPLWQAGWTEGVVKDSLSGKEFQVIEEGCRVVLAAKEGMLLV